MNLLAPETYHGIFARLMENPFKMGAIGTGGGSATMFLATLAERADVWEVFDKLVFRVGAVAAALSSILMVVLMIYKVQKARKNSIEQDEHD